MEFLDLVAEVAGDLRRKDVVNQAVSSAVIVARCHAGLTDAGSGEAGALCGHCSL